MTHTVRDIRQENKTPSRASHEGQSESIINSLSSSETASMVVLVKVDKSHSAPVELQPQQSAENGTKEMSHSVRVLK